MRAREKRDRKENQRQRADSPRNGCCCKGEQRSRTVAGGALGLREFHLMIKKNEGACLYLTQEKII